MHGVIHVHSIHFCHVINFEQKCNKTCDFCKNPAAAKELAESARLCQTGKKLLGSLVESSANLGKPDPSLYGGGKYGYRR